MSLQTTHIQSPNFPPLAWCLELEHGTPCVRLIHGVRVEKSGQYFVEGAWDGDLTAMRPDQAGFLAGSGGRIGDDGCELFTPSHTLEAIYTIELPERWIASNSLVFALQMGSLELDPDYRRYLLDLRTITRGLKRYVRTLPTLNGPRVERHFFCNLRVSQAADGHWKCVIEPKPQPPRFDSFQDYVTYLRTTVAAILANAADPSRTRVYRPLATLSRGYDSTACATLVASLGYRDAITIRDASWGATAIDSGAEIGRHLGLVVTEAGGRDYLQRSGTPEAEFVALGDAGDVQLAGFEEQLAGRVLITGFHGDKMWDPNTKQSGPDIVRGDASGSSLAEFRYRVGFLHLPVPFIACQRHEDVHRISNAPEMAPWRVGGDYDRPIPRRIAEEGGVPRELFGQKKAASAIWWTRAEPAEATKASYREYRERHRRGGLDAGAWIHACAYQCSRLWERLASLLFRLTRKLGFAVRLPQIIPYRYTEPPAEAQLVQWGVAMLRERYPISFGQDGVHQYTIRGRIVDWDVRREDSDDPT